MVVAKVRSMSTGCAFRYLVACAMTAGLLSGRSALADGACSRLADHPNDVLTANGELYTDQGAGGRLDFIEASFARSGTDLAIELHVDDFTEPHISDTRSEYWVSWDSSGGSVRLDIVDETGTWSFSASRTDDTVSLLAHAAEGDLNLTVMGSVDEEAGIISALVRDVSPNPAGVLTSVVVGSAEGRASVLGYPGDLILSINSMTVDLDAACVTPPDPLRAWCRELHDPVGDSKTWLSQEPAPGYGDRVDLTRVEFLPSSADLIALILVDDLDGSRTDQTNASRFWLRGAVSGADLGVNAYEMDDVWVADAAVGGEDVAVEVSVDVDGNLIRIEIPGILLAESPRYLVAEVFSAEGIGANTPVGTVFEPEWSSDFVYPRQDQDLGYRTAIDLDATCPWPGN